MGCILVRDCIWTKVLYVLKEEFCEEIIYVFLGFWIAKGSMEECWNSLEGTKGKSSRRQPNQNAKNEELKAIIPTQSRGEML